MRRTNAFIDGNAELIANYYLIVFQMETDFNSSIENVLDLCIFPKKSPIYLYRFYKMSAEELRKYNFFVLNKRLFAFKKIWL